MRALRPLLVSTPALAIALLGLAHPVFLTPSTADRWQLVHLALLPAFPLLAVALWHLLRAERGLAGWAARVAAFAYAVLYGALDAIAGIGAPEQVRDAGAGAPPPIGSLYDVGDRLGHVGVIALAAATALTAGLTWRRRRNPVSLLGGAVLVASCIPFYRHHVFPARGVLAMVGIGAGLYLLALAARPEPTGR